MPILPVHLPLKHAYLPLVAPGGTLNMDHVTYQPASLQYPGDVQALPDLAVPMPRLTRAKLTEPVKVTFPNPEGTQINFPRDSFVYIVNNAAGTPQHVMLQTRPEYPMQPMVVPQGGTRRYRNKRRETRKRRRTSLRRRARK